MAALRRNERWARWKTWARGLKRDLAALALACSDRRTPLAARLVAILVIGYALSPIDLIPDFIPLLGQLDDLVLLPLGILLVRRLIPAALFDEWRSRVEQSPPQRRAALIGLGLLLVLACWATVVYGGWRWFRGGAT